VDEAPDDNTPSLPALLSARQVAAIFDRSERTVRNWIRAGHLRPVRVGRSVFFRADDVAALLDDGSPPRKK
jgi:excisionase family DNA binding protein